MKYLIFALLLGLTAIGNVILANTANVTWTSPTQYEDGTSIPSGAIKNFKIYYGSNQGGPYQFVATVSGSATSATINDLPNGTWYFVATTVTVDDVESKPTPEVSKVINVAKRPRAPQNFVVQ